MGKNLKILSLNVNNFGGSDQKFNLQSILYNYNEMGYKIWNEHISKNPQFRNDILKYITESNDFPDIIILQEFRAKSGDGLLFIDKMDTLGYKLIRECNNIMIDPSMTIIFVKKTLDAIHIKSIHDKSSYMRACTIKVDGMYIYGTHAPIRHKDKNNKEIKKVYWNEIKNFVVNTQNEKLLLIGDFNIIDNKVASEENSKKIHNSEFFDDFKNDVEKNGYTIYDLWLEKGVKTAKNIIATIGNNDNKKGLRVDRVFGNSNVIDNVKSVIIDPRPKKEGFTDHSALVVDITIP